MDVLVTAAISQSYQVVKSAIWNALNVNKHSVAGQIEVRRADDMDPIRSYCERFQGRVVFWVRRGRASRVSPGPVRVGELVYSEDPLRVLPLAFLLLHGGEKAQVILL